MSDRRGVVLVDVLVALGTGVLTGVTASVVVGAVQEATGISLSLPVIISGAVVVGIWARVEVGHAQLRREFRAEFRDLASTVNTLRERLGDQSVRDQVSHWMSKVGSQYGATIGALDLRMTQRADYVDARLAELERQLRELR